LPTAREPLDQPQRPLDVHGPANLDAQRQRRRPRRRELMRVNVELARARTGPLLRRSDTLFQLNELPQARIGTLPAGRLNRHVGGGIERRLVQQRRIKLAERDGEISRRHDRPFFRSPAELHDGAQAADEAMLARPQVRRGRPARQRPNVIVVRVERVHGVKRGADGLWPGVRAHQRSAGRHEPRTDHLVT